MTKAHHLITKAQHIRKKKHIVSIYNNKQTTMALYNKLRTTYSTDIFTHYYVGTLDDKLVYAMTNHPRMLAKFLVYAYLLRRKYMYK